MRQKAIKKVKRQIDDFFSICAAFEEIERVALKPPQSTKEMIELGEYMLHVKNKKMIQLSVRKL